MKRLLFLPLFSLCLASAAMLAIPFIPLLKPTHIAFAQQAPMHLNPAIAKLAAGQVIIGGQTQDATIGNCRSIARMNYDYVYLNMDSILDIPGMANCAAFKVDVAEALKRDNAQQKVALFARFPPDGREMANNEWLTKEALDAGMMGVVFNVTDDAETARHEVESMRYPQTRGSKYPEPAGRRANGGAAFVWGVSNAEYEKHADVWPLNPEGDLLCIVMIDSAEGLKNVDSIAAVPGVGVIFIGSSEELARSLGVPENSAEIEADRQTILASCKAHNVVCGIMPTSKADMDRRLKEGWRMFRTTPELAAQYMGK